MDTITCNETIVESTCVWMVRELSGLLLETLLGAIVQGFGALDQQVKAEGVNRVEQLIALEEDVKDVIDSEGQRQKEERASLERRQADALLALREEQTQLADHQQQQHSELTTILKAEIKARRHGEEQGKQWFAKLEAAAEQATAVSRAAIGECRAAAKADMAILSEELVQQKIQFQLSMTQMQQRHQSVEEARTLSLQKVVRNG